MPNNIRRIEQCPDCLRQTFFSTTVHPERAASMCLAFPTPRLFAMPLQALCFKLGRPVFKHRQASATSKLSTACVSCFWRIRLGSPASVLCRPAIYAEGNMEETKQHFDKPCKQGVLGNRQQDAGTCRCVLVLLVTGFCESVAVQSQHRLKRIS